MASYQKKIKKKFKTKKLITKYLFAIFLFLFFLISLNMPVIILEKYNWTLYINIISIILILITKLTIDFKLKSFYKQRSINFLIGNAVWIMSLALLLFSPLAGIILNFFSYYLLIELYTWPKFFSYTFKSFINIAGFAIILFIYIICARITIAFSEDLIISLIGFAIQVFFTFYLIFAFVLLIIKTQNLLVYLGENENTN